jgi:membrane dipeptidase
VLPVYTADDDLRELLGWIEAGHRITEGNADVVELCGTGADIDRALAGGRIALILALEGCGALGTAVGLLDTMFRLGVRMVSFTHMGRTGFADGSAEDSTGSRLTAAGVEALAAVEELGMLMDVSHLSASGVDDVLERATRPVVASHSCAFALHEHHRNLTDERLSAIAASGGVVGVNFVGTYLDANHPSVGRAIDHILNVASKAGADHVGIGSDFIEQYGREAEPRLLEFVTPGLAGPADLPLVTDALLERGTSQQQIRKILGENWLRVFRAEMGLPAR